MKKKKCIHIKILFINPYKKLNYKNYLEKKNMNNFREYLLINCFHKKSQFNSHFLKHLNELTEEYYYQF